MYFDPFSLVMPQHQRHTHSSLEDKSQKRQVLQQMRLWYSHPVNASISSCSGMRPTLSSFEGFTCTLRSAFIADWGQYHVRSSERLAVA